MDDLISRQAAIDALSHMCSEDKNGITVSRANVDSMLRYLPSAQPEERKESLCKKVRALCEESKIEFFFVGGGESTWSVTNDKHIKKIVECHKAQLLQERTEDTVSRQRLLSDLKELVAAWKKYPVMAEQIKGVEAAIGYVEAIPSAQSEIVRCKDCEYRHIENMVWACPFGLSGGPDFYCGYGAERRSDGNL